MINSNLPPPPASSKLYKSTIILGGVAYSVLMILAVLFYKQRTIFLDIAYHLFYLLKDGTYAIQNYRFGSFFTQSFPLIGKYLGLSLDSIVIMYSLSFLILYAGTFFILTLIFKNVKLGIAWLLFNILIVTHTFFWIQSELPQGMAFGFIYYALLYKSIEAKDYRPHILILMAGLLITTIFTHPLLLIAVIFVLFFYWNMNRGEWKFIGLNFAIALGIYQLRSKVFSTPYDETAFLGLDNFSIYFPHYFNITSNRNFINYLLQDYYFLILLVAVVSFGLFYRRLWFTWLLSAGFSIAYLLLINVSYYHGADQFYLENMYLILTIFWTFPLVYHVAQTPIMRKWLIPSLLLICIVSFIRIYQTHPQYSERLEWYRSFLTETENVEHQKLILQVEDVPVEKLMMPWASAYEFWLLSTMETGETKSIVIEHSKGELVWGMNDREVFLTRWGMFPYDALPEKYFIFRDTSKYKYYQLSNH